jgi:predicted nucleic acid-binding Zn ribbon protein
MRSVQGAEHVRRWQGEHYHFWAIGCSAGSVCLTASFVLHCPATVQVCGEKCASVRGASRRRQRTSAHVAPRIAIGLPST